MNSPGVIAPVKTRNIQVVIDTLDSVKNLSQILVGGSRSG
jgi:hypothetical protein